MESMQFRHIVITGGAGFVGCNLAMLFRESFPDIKVTTFDNLKRRGAELNLTGLKQVGAEFIHGDIRCQEDLESLSDFDLMIDCSAEPSVQAGIHGSPCGVIQHNLIGTINCIEKARKQNAAFLFLSSSRIFPIETINNLDTDETETRFVWTGKENLPGFSAAGIAEEFPLKGSRSMYGATKLSAELLLQEFNYSYNMPVMINRCGILTGPRQMGKVDQGVITLWVAHHEFEKSLKYIGFEGSGKQVRDMLHVQDLFQLIVKQMNRLETWDARAYNVGGGNEISTSLKELTQICETITGKSIPIKPVIETSAVDIKIYITDSAKVKNEFDWKPEKTVDYIIQDIHEWILTNRNELEFVLG
jgi:CDP-paratose 2-epimerase